MKHFYSFLLLITATAMSFGQVVLPYYESFNYTVASNLGGQGGWVNVNTGDEVLVTSGNLSYTGLASSLGNSVNFAGIGIDPQLTMTSQTTNTVYASFILKVTDLAGVTDVNGGYFAGFGTNSTTFSSTIWVKTNGTQFNIGLDKNSSTTNLQYAGTLFDINTNIFVVISYDFTTNESKIWINPAASTLGLASLPASTLTATLGTNRTSIDRFILRQDSVTETPAITIDELRIGNTWADVTPSAPLSVEDVNNSFESKVKFSSTIVSDKVSIFNAGKTNVELYNFNGQLLKTATGSDEITLDTATLSKGVYLVKVYQDNKSITKKIIKK